MAKTTARIRTSLLICSTIVLSATACSSDSADDGAASAAQDDTAQGQLETSLPTALANPSENPEQGDSPDVGVPSEDEIPEVGSAEFQRVLDNAGVVLPEGQDAETLGRDTCAQFDQGKNTNDVATWLGETAQLDAEQQGLFIGVAISTFCPNNFEKAY